MILCHGHALATLAARPLQRRQGVPYGLVTHGDIFHRPPGTYDRLLTSFYKSVTRPAYRHADLIIALSPAMAARAVEGGAAEDKTIVIPNGIDPGDLGLPTTAEPTHFRTPNGPFRLLFVGRLGVEKGVIFLLEACAELQRWDIDFQLRVIGAGPDEDHYQYYVHRQGLGEKVDFIGNIPRAKLGAHYHWADLVCVPSLDDTLPAVVLEALAAGTPVLGTEVGGIPFMVRHDQNGLLVTPGSPGAISDAIKDLATDPKRLRRLADNAAPSVLSRFSWETVGQCLAEGIEKTIAGRESSVGAI
jgi:glycosyltransferase involved in cell wall biosynthesis